MQKFINFTFIWSVLIALLISSIDAKKTKFSKQSKKESLNDGYYAIFVNTTLTTSSGNNHNKREIQEEFINSLVDEIHNLILDHVETYQNSDIIEEMINTEKLRKRENEESEFEVIYHLSSLDNQSVIGAYLSDKIIDYIKENFNCIYDIFPNRYFKYGYYISKENIPEARHNSDFHLSLISQDNLTGKDYRDYDYTYYPLKPAGEGIDIFIFDSNFSFDDSEFKNNDKRITKCVANLSYGKVELPYSESYCYSMHRGEHGTIVADVAAGAEHGVASNANVYGFILEEEPTFFSILKGLELLNHGNSKKRAVVNLSIGDYFSKIGKHSDLIYFHDLIKKLTEKGYIFVSCAQNDSRPVIDTKENETVYPCAFDEVICVGATYSPYLFYFDGLQNKDIVLNPYKIAEYSNYGDGVDIYAPGNVRYSVYNPYYGMKEGMEQGTSFATPIVTGVVASILSQNPLVDYNVETMKKELKRISYQGVIEGIDKNHESNYFINNGAVIYPKRNNGKVNETNLS